LIKHEAYLIIRGHLDETVSNVNQFERTFEVEKFQRFLLPIFLVDFLQLGRALDDELGDEAEDAISRLAISIATPLVILVIVRDVAVTRA